MENKLKKKKEKFQGRKQKCIIKQENAIAACVARKKEEKMEKPNPKQINCVASDLEYKRDSTN